MTVRRANRILVEIKIQKFSSHVQRDYPEKEEMLSTSITDTNSRIPFLGLFIYSTKIVGDNQQTLTD